MYNRIKNTRTTIVICAVSITGFSLTSCQAPQPRVINTVPAATIVGEQKVDASPVYRKLDTNTYPTFSQPMTAAGTQMTNDEALTMEQSMSSLTSARKSGSMSEAEYKRRVDELRSLSEGQVAPVRQ